VSAPGSSLVRALFALIEGEALSPGNLDACFGEILAGTVPPEQISGFLVALRMRGETLPYLLAGVNAVRRGQPCAEPAGDPIDIGGTGGDHGRTFNVSTVAALVAAAAGCLVFKHGNAAVSGKCGSMDLVAELGLKLAATLDEAIRGLAEHGIAFLHTRDHVRYPPVLQQARRHLGIRTLFNLIGPWCNPGRTRRQVIGVAEAQHLPTFAELAVALGYQRVVLIHGTADGSDEFSISGTSSLTVVSQGTIERREVCPEEFGFPAAPVERIAGGDARHNAEIARRILAGAEHGPCRHVVLMTAGAGLYVRGLANSLEEGAATAGRAIDDGRALQLLNRLRASG
jgi:anthranilate phosphoribosyltransferase